MTQLIMGIFSGPSQTNKSVLRWLLNTGPAIGVQISKGERGCTDAPLNVQAQDLKRVSAGQTQAI
jgi:hypothetical protein